MRWTKPLLDLNAPVERVHLPISPVFFRWSPLFAKYDRSSLLFFLLSLPLPFVPTGAQRDILLLFYLLARISLRIPWAMRNQRSERGVSGKEAT